MARHLESWLLFAQWPGACFATSDMVEINYNKAMEGSARVCPNKCITKKNSSPAVGDLREFFAVSGFPTRFPEDL